MVLLSQQPIELVLAPLLFQVNCMYHLLLIDCNVMLESTASANYVEARYLTRLAVRVSVALSCYVGCCLVIVIFCLLKIDIIIFLL